ncbi:hypothetical protein BP6252_10482 [Coleophoma cylindrospora]|uniref:Uncharacterized protein n=1 Tax=Coleophoma cylindrospora TaxID=1849047 RepID=A0A3D8QT10_9HELO|nr:hypothetical protein BP6252_10482 [Coleophoma cylindrospora]
MRSSKQKSYGFLRENESSRWSAEPRDEDGNIIGSQTSQAQRKRRRPGASMKECGYNDPEGKIQDFDYSPMFHQNSTVHYTWGKTESYGIIAPRRKRRRTVPKMKVGPNNLAGYSIFDDLAMDPEPIVPNSPERSGIFRIPLEVRELIYEYLLLYSKPILLDREWTKVEKRPDLNHSIMMTCKQISEESSAFFYRNNYFVALIRNQPPRKAWDVYIDSAKYLPLLKHAVVKVGYQADPQEWDRMTASCLRSLVQAQTRLKSLTLALQPLQKSSFYMPWFEEGIVGNKFGTPGFLAVHGAVMKAVKHVRCQVFNVVLNMFDGKKLLISVAMTGLTSMKTDTKTLEHADAEQKAKLMVNGVERQLLELKKRAKAIFKDSAKAIEEGKCRVLQEDEAVIYGLDPATEHQSDERRFLWL